MLQKRSNSSTIFFIAALLIAFSGHTNALSSSCLKIPGVTISHEVTWTMLEQIVFVLTQYETEAEGPNGIAFKSDIMQSTSPQPLRHLLINWAPGAWQIVGDSGQFSIVSLFPVEIITNPNPGGCIEDYTLP